MVKMLVDTNAAIAIINGDSVVDLLLENANIFISTIVVGELLYGASYSSRPIQNSENVFAFIKNVGLLLCDEVTAQHYGKIKAVLRTIGRPIPDNDIWIAACSMQHDLSLVTRDAHFQNVEGLDVVAW
jgi:tRNA(fMet)-specific endonuclease VapC